MQVFLIVLGAPALVFAIFATAFGFNPIRAAAWGAILGMATAVCVVAYTIVSYQTSRPPLAWQPPATDPVAPEPSVGAVKHGAFDDLVPATGNSAKPVDPAPGKLY